MERETGIEPATNGLGSRDSTTELLPLSILIIEDSPYRINFSDSSGLEDDEGTPVPNLFQN
jgi:hypothetical protein